MVGCEANIFKRLEIRQETYFDVVFESTMFSIIQKKIEEDIKAQ